jgi:hypothetical protein
MEFPHISNSDYKFNPRPIGYVPPIAKEEFYHRFYTCYRPRPLLHWFHKCRKICKSREALNLLPKRTYFLEEGGDTREEFWGIYAQERPCFLTFSIYNCLCIVPSLAFLFLWLFSWGHAGDLQNASVPLSISATTLSILWAYMLTEFYTFAK